MSYQPDPKYFDWGSAFQGGIQQSQDNKRRNALMDLEQRQFGLQEQRVGLEQKRYDQAEQERLAGMESQQRQDALKTSLLRYMSGDKSAAQRIAELDGLDQEDLQGLDFDKYVQYKVQTEHPELMREQPIGQLYQVEGPQGPQYVTGSQALGQTPYRAPPAPQQQQPPVQFLDDAGNPVWGTREQALGKRPVPPASSQPKPLSPKEAATAKTKLTLIGQAKQQLALVKQRIKEAKGVTSGGYWGVQALVPSEKGKLLDGAVDSMRNIVTSLTRTPGIGANSDFETRLQQAQLPVRTDREAVQDQKAQSMQELLDALEGGYSDLIGQEPPEQDSGWTDL